MMSNRSLLALVVFLLGRALALAEVPATTHDCAKTKNVSVPTSKTTLRVIGMCNKVTVIGSGNTVTIEATTNLSVTGSKNVVSARKVDKIAAVGAQNQIGFTSGLRLDAPKVADSGKRNAIGPDGGVAGGGPALPPPAPSTRECKDKVAQTLVDDDTTTSVTGACQIVTVAGNKMTVTVASAATIYVSGNDNTVTAIAVDEIAVPGKGNKVTWKKAATKARTKLTITGSGNAVTQAK